MKIYFQHYNLSQGVYGDRGAYGVYDTDTLKQSLVTITTLIGREDFSRGTPCTPDVFNQSWTDYFKITNVLESWLPFLYTNGIRDDTYDPAYWSDGKLKNAVELKTDLWSAYPEYKRRFNVDVPYKQRPLYTSDVSSQIWPLYFHVTNPQESCLKFIYANGVQDDAYDPAYWSDGRLTQEIKKNSLIYSAYDEYNRRFNLNIPYSSESLRSLKSNFLYAEIPPTSDVGEAALYATYNVNNDNENLNDFRIRVIASKSDPRYNEQFNINVGIASHEVRIERRREEQLVTQGLVSLAAFVVSGPVLGEIFGGAAEATTLVEAATAAGTAVSKMEEFVPTVPKEIPQIALKPVTIKPKKIKHVSLFSHFVLLL